MECTQRLECTQELYETHTERVCPEQIGFLGICGAKHPVLRGPNKVGRDPHTCNIVLNLNSVSRQHAVINVLSSKEFMLMDLDSANKTKLLNKTLQPYIPHPIKDGDTVQFGDIFGVFRLLEENDELPMTQAIDIPETPLPSKHVSKLTKAPTTVIPESPDVSDKDDTFVTPTHSRNVTTTRLSSGQFIKPFGKSISIQPVSTPKSDTSRNSSKRPLSFEDKANDSLNESNTSLKDENDIHEMDTQAPFPNTKPKNDIHEMDTQVPYPITKPTVNESTDSIYMADTQAPPGHDVSPSIHSLDTQIPTIEHLPQVRKISNQQDMHFDIYAANKENDLSIFNAETQPFVCEKRKSIDRAKISDVSPKSASKSEEELLFNEIEDECLEDFNSQPLLPQESLKHELSSPKAPKKIQTVIDSDGSTDCEDIDMAPTQKVEELPVKAMPVKEKFKPTVSKGNKRIESDDSTDCEDIEFMPTQKISELPEINKPKANKGKVKNTAKRVNRIKSDSSTDCEEIDMIPTQKVLEKKDNKEDDLTDCEDDFIETTSKKPKSVEVTDFEDMPTQVIDIDPDKIKKTDFHNMDTQIVHVVENTATKSGKDVDFEDQPTQIIDEIIPNNSETTKKLLVKTVSPFKIPLQSPIRVKSREIPKVPKPKISNIITVDDDNYYNATQDILDDLCTQRDGSPILGIVNKGLNSPITIDDDVVPCSVEDYKVAEKFANIDRELLSPTFRDQKAKKNVANLSSQDVLDVIGVDLPIAKLRKMPSDSSDVESTPKKVRLILFTDSDLPNSQEIKTSMHIQYSKPCATDSSSESEPEQNSEYSQEVTPFVHRKKKLNPVSKIDLTKKFDAEKLPERIITRVRKPTSKVEENLQMAKKVSANILKPKYLTEQEDQIDQDIITENVKRLKTYEKAKSNKETKSENKTIDAKSNIKTNEREIENKADIQEDKMKNKNKTEIKRKEPKEKIKVKIEKPKQKDSKSKNKDEIATRNSKEETTRKSREKTHKESTNKDDERNKSKESFSTDDKVKTRSRRRKEDESKSITPESKKEDSRKKRPIRKKEPAKESVSPEVEVRRSKRQAKVKENKSDSQTVQTIQPKSILKKSIHEQSTVYNESTSSGESPKNLKRSLVDDGEVPSPKRTRAFVNNVNNSMNNVSLRATPARTMKTQYVLFTAFPSEEVKHKLEKLGAVIVTDVMQCSVVLTMQVKRTFKLLCAVGLGRPIVGPGWVQACVDTHMIVDPWLYLIKDEPAEKRFRFCLDRTLNGKRNFLKGYNVSSTPSVQPNGSEMRLIVECSGGVWKESGPNWVCVSSTKDQALWSQLRKRGAVIVSTEFILGGVLRQQLDINSNKFL